MAQRNQPPDRLPPEVRDHSEVVRACRDWNIGRLFRVVNNLTEESAKFTVTHIGRLCGLSVSRVGEYMKDAHRVTSVGVIERIADGLQVPGERFGLAPRPWEPSITASKPRQMMGSEVLPAAEQRLPTRCDQWSDGYVVSDATLRTGQADSTGLVLSSLPAPLNGDLGPAASQQAWRATRQHLIRHRTQLAELAGLLYEPSWLLPETPMLSSDAWLPETPIPLEKVRLEWEPEVPKPIILGQESQLHSTLPLRAPGQTFPSYSSAIRYLSRPNLFENRPSYRLLDASLNAGSGGLLRFGQASYFDKIDVSEALGHELASMAMRASVSWSNLPFRSLMADPYDLAVRTVNASITTLTVRVDANTRTATFFLLRRDPAKVVTGGGEYGVVPAGEFQPASISPDSLLADLDLWRNIVREYSEELLGQPEHDGSSGRPLDYESWPFYRAMQRARLAGQVRAYVLGIAFNALSLNATIITATIIDSVAFDGLFRGMASVNAEGEIVTGMGNNTSAHGIPFDQETVNHFLHGEPLLSPQAAASLSLTWRHRKSLLHGCYA